MFAYCREGLSACYGLTEKQIPAYNINRGVSLKGETVSAIERLAGMPPDTVMYTTDRERDPGGGFRRVAILGEHTDAGSWFGEALLARSRPRTCRGEGESLGPYDGVSTSATTMSCHARRDAKLLLWSKDREKNDKVFQ